MTDYEMKGKFELSHNLELISEEQRPSLYSLSSFTNSICSDSTIDLVELDHIDPTICDSNSHAKIESKPLQNNFLTEEPIQPAYNERKSEIIAQEPSIKVIKQSHPSFSKSLSLHDVSNILPLNPTGKSNTVSCETINSHSLSSTTKSKDSGFQRSLSCLSLTSGKRNYSHVESKVKAYINNIKENEALNKKNKLLQKQQKTEEQVISANDSTDFVAKDDLIKENQELKHELHEKSLYIDAQQRNYNKLLLQYAEAKNIIDHYKVQSISLNYSTANYSQSQFSSMSYINLDTFDYKLKKDFSQFGSCITEDSAEKSASVVAESKSKVLQENFKPCNHSSPYEKSLSPVRRMFSSSSRLDKNYQPLTNPKRCNFQSTKPKPQAQNRYNGQPLADCFGGALKNGCFKLNNHSNLLRRQSMSIDLPNDDPFDKVKKWQASLPSINLLGTHSSSDCEELEHHSPDPCPCESNPVKCSLAKNGVNESEICNILSQELKNKCIITEMEVDMEPEFSIMKNNDDITKSSKKENQVNTHLSTFRTGDEEAKPLFINNNCLSSNNRYVIHLKQQNKTKKSLNCPMRENFVEERLPSSELESKNTELVPLWSRESSESEDCSTHLPKSSSISNRRINKIEDSENSDDSSSVSSSVLGSDSPSVMGSSKRVKRRLVLCEDKFSSKVPKITKSKSSQTTFILKEAMLNFTPPMENNRAQIKNQISSKNMSTNYETWYKHRHSSHPPIISVMTESSQRKAWNARNNANFYVCKDFPFTKSTSLMECIKDMEGLVSKGSLVIRSVVDRNNSRPTC